MTVTQRHKVFTSKPKVQIPVTFDVTGDGFTETFSAVPAIPGAQLLDFISDADSNDGGRASQALIDFMQSVILDDDKERFAELIRDPDKVIEIELLAEICEWLVGEYAARPTEQPKRSAAGRPQNGTGSTATVSSSE